MHSFGLQLQPRPSLISGSSETRNRVVRVVANQVARLHSLTHQQPPVPPGHRAEVTCKRPVCSRCPFLANSHFRLGQTSWSGLTSSVGVHARGGHPVGLVSVVDGHWHSLRGRQRPPSNSIPLTGGVERPTSQMPIGQYWRPRHFESETLGVLTDPSSPTGKATRQLCPPLPETSAPDWLAGWLAGRGVDRSGRQSGRADLSHGDNPNAIGYKEKIYF
ncbi:unnamed protein product [Protopolystoma xenopodis]|uniref:Uncharacterized protein n=1 Tax=Protopolystoma xenopodis TaxID=117903 RepID=A0A448XFX0_9PLAT|nr:unnamed protein product [Protopolystoma xenopodis]